MLQFHSDTLPDLTVDRGFCNSAIFHVDRYVGRACNAIAYKVHFDRCVLAHPFGMYRLLSIHWQYWFAQSFRQHDLPCAHEVFPEQGRLFI